MNYVYCEHLDDMDAVNRPGSDIRLDPMEGSGTPQEITKEKYEASGPEESDPLNLYLEETGSSLARGYNCPICMDLGRDQKVFFIYDGRLKDYRSSCGEVAVPFARLRMKSPNRFVRDPITETLSMHSLYCASHFES